MITLSNIVLAQNRIKPFLNPSLLEAAPGLGENVFLKLENTNPTHSFKIRGALNAILALDDEAKKRGIIAASTGNHAQAVAYASRLVGAKATICMPRHTPERKVNGVINNGATPLLDAANYDEAETMARKMEKEKGMTFVSAYNDPFVAAGQGTIGLEIVETMPDVELVMAPVSGGGLMAGVSTAIKSLVPNATVIGVNAETGAAMYNEFYGSNLPINDPTLAEALSGDIEDGCFCIEACKQNVDEIVLVTEEQIAEAMRWMADVQGWMVEGGGSVCVAALLSGAVQTNGRKTALVISGGNVDGQTLRKVLGLGGI